MNQELFKDFLVEAYMVPRPIAYVCWVFSEPGAWNDLVRKQGQQNSDTVEEAPQCLLTLPANQLSASSVKKFLRTLFLPRFFRDIIPWDEFILLMVHFCSWIYIMDVWSHHL